MAFCTRLEEAVVAVVDRGHEANDQAAHNRSVGGSNPPGPTDFALFLKKISLFSKKSRLI